MNQGHSSLLSSNAFTQNEPNILLKRHKGQYTVVYTEKSSINRYDMINKVRWCLSAV